MLLEVGDSLLELSGSVDEEIRSFSFFFTSGALRCY